MLAQSLKWWLTQTQVHLVIKARCWGGIPWALIPPYIAIHEGLPLISVILTNLKMSFLYFMHLQVHFNMWCVATPPGQSGSLRNQNISENNKMMLGDENLQILFYSESLMSDLPYDWLLDSTVSRIPDARQELPMNAVDDQIQDGMPVSKCNMKTDSILKPTQHHECDMYLGSSDEINTRALWWYDRPYSGPNTCIKKEHEHIDWMLTKSWFMQDMNTLILLWSADKYLSSIHKFDSHSNACYGANIL